MIDKVFIIHWKELVERKNYIISNLGNVEFIEEFDRNTIDKDLISKWYKVDPEKWNNRCLGIYKEIPEFRELRVSEICNSFSHLKAIEKIVENNYNTSLILEDDVIFNQNFQNFDYLLNKTPKDFDIIFLGSSFSVYLLDVHVPYDNSHPIKINGDMVYEKVNHPKTRTVDAYILSLNDAKKLKNTISDFSHAFDFDLAYFIKQLDLKVYWWEPGLVCQGSQLGQYKSSIR